MIDLVDLIVVSAYVRILNIESLVLLGAKLMILNGGFGQSLWQQLTGNEFDTVARSF